MATRKKVTAPTAHDFSEEISSKVTIDDISFKDDVQERILIELRKQNEYLHRMDWKFWSIMQMITIIGQENGYMFDINEREQGEEK